MDLKSQITEIKKCDQFESAALQIAELDIRQLHSRHIISISRQLERLGDEPNIKIAYLSNFVLDMLPAYVSVYAARDKICCGSYLGAYNQYFQELLAQESPLIKYEPDVVLLSLTMEQLEPEIFYRFSSLSLERKVELLDQIVSTIKKWIRLAQEKLNAVLLISNFPLPGYTQSGIADVNNLFGEIRFYNELNSRMAELVSENPRAHLLDLSKLAARFGTDNVYDPKMYYMAKINWSEGFHAVVADEIHRYIIGITGRSRKCLVLDLDNTLWGGVLGEEGPLSVKVGPGEPVSEAYRDFQYKIKALKDRGIMLAICSKNNHDDVLEVFEKRPDMPLQLSDFAATRINWEHKHINIQRIAKDLNIGLDSMVFLDDNPAECSLIQQMLPGVKTVLVPPKPENMPAVIDSLVDFEKIIILEDDLKKTEQYHQKKQRQKLQEDVGDLDSYLQSLEIEIHITAPLKENLNRVHQLYTKTNQFNVTTVRYSMSEIEKQLNDDSYDLFIISAKDRFGDLGIIGLYLVELSAPKARIDSFILSCRAMGRGIESAIMNHLKNRYYNQRDNIRLLEGSYIPTPKNKPVKDFFDKQGFKILKQNEKDEKLYQLASDDILPVDCSWIKVTES